MEKIENDGIAKRVYAGECASSRSVGRPRKRWINSVKDFLKKKGLDVMEARRMVHDKRVWRGFMRVECMGRCSDNEPLTLTRCYSLELPQL